MTVYFKVAVQNFDQTIFDTDDLSITRGSSLTALAMPLTLKSHLTASFGEYEFDFIQASASELIFSVTGSATGLTIKAVTASKPSGMKLQKYKKILSPAVENVRSDISDAALFSQSDQILSDYPEIDFAREIVAGHILKRLGTNAARSAADISDDETDRICVSVRAFLSKQQGDWPFDLLMYGVESFKSMKSSPHPSEVIGALDTRLGRNRLQNWTCKISEPVDLSSLDAEKALCAFTGIDASAKGHVEKGRPISRSAQRRRKVGREQKTHLYDSIIDEARLLTNQMNKDDPAIVRAVSNLDTVKDTPAFAGDFSEIVTGSPDGLPLSLESKMAVLHMDGNGFGARRGKLADFEAYKNFSGRLDVLKAGLLAELINWFGDTPEMSVELDDVMTTRFETLLWGGDEFMFVVPAWMGWKFASKVQDCVSEWTADGTPLTFSYGMVFAPHNAPIRDLKNVAKELSDLAKGDRKSARMQVLAFEGIDRVHYSPTSFRKDWLGIDPKAVPSKLFSIAVEDAQQLPETLKATTTAISRSALHNLYFEHESMLAEKAPHHKIREQIGRIAPTMDDEKLEQLIKGIFPTEETEFPLIRFAELNLLYDYILAGVVE